MVLLFGCGRPPSQVNIQLRKQIQELESQIAGLQRARQADAATIRSLEQQATTIPTLPQERLEELVTVHGLKFGRLTGGLDEDPSHPGDEALKVYVVPIDAGGDAIKAAGSFTIEAYDLSLPHDNRLVHREFTSAEASKNWYGDFLLYTYAFTCPWERPPHADHVTVRVTFRDALTGRVFTEQKVVSVVPPTAEPSTGPAAQR